MEKFVDLGVSFFDPQFTLNPHLYLADLYPRDDILGFKSEGMNFVFRFDEAREVMFNRQCVREPVANPEIAAREAVFAQRYPNRARNFQLTYTHGTPDPRLKKLLKAYIADVAQTADFDGTEAIYQQLSSGVDLQNYVEDICTLPLRIMLTTSGLPFSEQQLQALYQAGFRFLKPLDNFIDEAPLAEADRAVAYVWDYLADALQQADPDAPISRFMRDGLAAGISEDVLVVNIGAFLVISLSNTAGVSSSYLLRNLIANPGLRQRLKAQPELLDRDSVIMEFLRRDNHVKALSRQVHEPFALGQYSMERGESINIFFPGINLDPGHWQRPLDIDLEREFTGENNIIFGGSMYMCIGKQLGITFLKHLARGFIEHLPDNVSLPDDDIEVDGGWVSERVITRMPISLA